MLLAWSQGESGTREIPSQPSEPLVAAVETAEQAALEPSAGAEPSVDPRADDRIATEGRGYTLIYHHVLRSVQEMYKCITYNFLY